MIEAAGRQRAQPAPPFVVAESLTEPDRDPARRWLVLLADEQPPEIVDVQGSELVVWSSLWPARPDALVRFELAADGNGGTDLRWTLLLDEPLPDDQLLGHLRKRLNVLINAGLRQSYGQ